MECQPRKHGYPLKMAQKKRILDAYPHFLLKVHKDLTTLHLSRFYIFNKNYGRTFYYKFWSFFVKRLSKLISNTICDASSRKRNAWDKLPALNDCTIGYYRILLHRILEIICQSELQRVWSTNFWTQRLLPNRYVRQTRTIFLLILDSYHYHECSSILGNNQHNSYFYMFSYRNAIIPHIVHRRHCLIDEEIWERNLIRYRSNTTSYRILSYLSIRKS